MKMGNIFWAKTDKHQKVNNELADKEDLKKKEYQQCKDHHIKKKSLFSTDLRIITTWAVVYKMQPYFRIKM